jgi:hypothetical protein
VESVARNSQGRHSLLSRYTSRLVIMRPSTKAQPRQNARTAMPESERLPPGRNSGAMAFGLGWTLGASLARICASSSGVHSCCSLPRFAGSEMSMFDPEDLSAVMVMIGSGRDEFRKDLDMTRRGLLRHVRAEKKDEQRSRAAAQVLPLRRRTTILSRSQRIVPLLLLYTRMRRASRVSSQRLKPFRSGVGLVILYYCDPAAAQSWQHPHAIVTRLVPAPALPPCSTGASPWICPKTGSAWRAGSSTMRSRLSSQPRERAVDKLANSTTEPARFPVES